MNKSQLNVGEWDGWMNEKGVYGRDGSVSI